HHSRKAFDNGRNEFLGHGSAEDVIDKLKLRLAALEIFALEELLVSRAELEGHLGEETRTTRLLFEALGVVDVGRQGFLIIYLGLALVAFYFELAAEAVYDDLEVEFT